MSSLTFDGQTLVLQTSYSPGLVADLKLRIPATERQWDAGRKVWRVAPQHTVQLVDLIQQHLGETLPAPTIQIRPSQTKTRLLDVRYIGVTKDRNDGSERTAFGWCDGAWTVIFSETVLRAWFDAPRRPDEGISLYQVLAVQPTSDAAALKTAYRRLARQWHPDVCQEPGATEVFKTIQHAWEILSDNRKRARYDAGLKLVATLGRADTVTPLHEAVCGYRSPLRCGLLMAEGQELLGRFVVSKLLAWEDISDTAGRTLSVSWPAGADKFVEVWL